MTMLRKVASCKPEPFAAIVPATPRGKNMRRRGWQAEIVGGAS
jgi:hypothetical protein